MKKNSSCKSDVFPDFELYREFVARYYNRMDEDDIREVYSVGLFIK
ncbi:MAG: hypothetical protein ACP5E3_06590 [Bacteroidales bacterium]